ncbi:DUF3263 domain-containing protein [Micromonospora echinaurantiaca]|uniref:DUF3263 domain-containing protein n=2 Tax=Micromonospora TaxID=1873 RepID=UPI00378F584D
MQPADAAPASETAAAGQGGRTGGSRAGVPTPRPAPAPEAAPVPPPRTAPEAETAPRSPAPAPRAEPVGRAAAADATPGPEALAGGATDPPGPADAAVPAAGDPPGPAAALTERERAIIAFEQQWWRHAGAKEQAIRDTFGLSATRYYQLLNALLDHPAALAAEPVLIGRLRRLRSSRSRNRRR